jgi:hypothetical protein
VKLEKEYGFHLCIRYRDFPPGDDIFDVVTTFMSKCREIIIVISDNFLCSTEYRFEFDHALLCAQQKNIFLKVITLGEISGEFLNPVATHVLERHHRLDWPDDLRKVQDQAIFWKILVGLLYGNWMQQSSCCSFGIQRAGYRQIPGNEN